MAFTRQQAWQYLQRAHAAGRLGHAYLITGAEGSGKNALALELTALVTGTTPETALQHPDVRLADPESKSRRIRIEQIRELEHALQLRAGGAGRKVAIVRDADRLQPQASNAFLKTLEEPPANCLLLLLTSQPESLLDTILSRCVRVPLRSTNEPPVGSHAKAVLELLAEISKIPSPQIPHVFQFVRNFQQVLADIKKSIVDAHAGEFKAEESLYKQSSDGKWLEEREEYYKAISEATYLRERSHVLQVLVQWWADVLHQQRGTHGRLHFPDYAAATAAVPPDVEPMEKIDHLEQLRDNLERNVQESLALEVAFIKVFLDRRT